MGKHALSSKLVAEKIAVFVSIAFLIIVLANCVPAARQLFLAAIPIYAGIFYILFYLPDRIEFDTENMYLTRRSRQYTIPLKDIYAIKLTLISIGSRSLWKIKFNVNNVEGDARFFNRRYFSPAFDNFCKTVKSLNPKVEITKFSRTFDFDL